MNPSIYPPIIKASVWDNIMEREFSPASGSKYAIPFPTKNYSNFFGSHKRKKACKESGLTGAEKRACAKQLRKAGWKKGQPLPASMAGISVADAAAPAAAPDASTPPMSAPPIPSMSPSAPPMGGGDSGAGIQSGAGDGSSASDSGASSSSAAPSAPSTPAASGMTTTNKLLIALGVVLVLGGGYYLMTHKAVAHVAE